MPNLYLAPNIVFKGRSFEDMLKPLAMYTDVYNKAEAAIGDLQAKAGIWENLANEQTDPIAYATYKRYADELMQQSKILATSRLTPSTSRDILDLRRRYASEIIPLEQAYANRKAQADEQRKALLQNPTLLFSRRADTTSLDDYVANPQLGYDVYSGALLTQQVGTAAAALAKKLRNATETGRLDQFTKVWIQRHGYTVEEVFQAMNDPENPKSNKVLTSIVNDVVGSSGIPQWGDRNILKQAYDYANQGLWNAVGETKLDRFDDKGAIMAAEEAKEMRLIRAREASQKRLIDYQNEQAAKAAKAAASNVPMYPDQIDSPDLEGKKAEGKGASILNYISSLKKDRDGRYYVNVARSNVGGQFFDANKISGSKVRNGEYSKYELQLTSAGGKFLTETQFVGANIDKFKIKPGTKVQSQEAYKRGIKDTESWLRTYYRNAIAGSARSVGLATDDVIGGHAHRLSVDELSKAASKTAEGSAPYRVNALEMRFGEARSKNKDVLEGLLPNVTYGEDKTYFREVKRISPTGKVEFSSKPVEIDEFINSDDKIKSIPTFWKLVTPEGTNGMLMKMSGKTYWISSDYLGSTFAGTDNYVNEINNLNNIRDNLINTYGTQNYYESKYAQMIEDAIDRYGGTTMREASSGLAGGYKPDAHALFTTSEEKEN